MAGSTFGHDGQLGLEEEMPLTGRSLSREEGDNRVGDSSMEGRARHHPHKSKGGPRRCGHLAMEGEALILNPRSSLCIFTEQDEKCSI